MRSFKRLLSLTSNLTGMAGSSKAASAAASSAATAPGNEGYVDEDVLPGAVVRSGPPFGGSSAAAAAGTSKAQVLSSPKVSMSLSSKESLRQRHGARAEEGDELQQQAEGHEGGQQQQQQQEAGRRPGGRLPPLEGMWRLSDPKDIKD
jgi:hypothetical protein